MSKVLKILILALALAFAAAQLKRPSRTNPPVDAARSIEAHVRVTPEAGAILERSCNDCHSNKTRWPWYSQVAPVSWFVADHVVEGRRELNFSDWARLEPREAAHMLEAMCKLSKRGAMPLSSYTLVHRDAELSPADRRTLCDWSQAESSRIAASLASGSSGR